MADKLIDEKAVINVYDPKVDKNQIRSDINKLESRSPKLNDSFLNVFDNPYDSCTNSHAIAIMTEWDQFIHYDWKKIYKSMIKPAFIFDGRNLLDKSKLEKIGFIYSAIGK